MTCLLGAAQLLAGSADAWHRTLIALFQPAEETGDGARGMVDDNLAALLPKVDVTPAADGGLREVAPVETAVLTVGSIRAGSKSNVIPDSAVLQLNIRTYDDATRSSVLAAIRRIVIAECQASDCPEEPDFELFDHFPLTTNDPEATRRVSAAFVDHFGDQAISLGQQSASEDFSDLPEALRSTYTFWCIGGADPDTYATAEAAGRVAQDIPVNHSATFAPVLQPTLDTGTQTLVVAALAWLGD